MRKYRFTTKLLAVFIAAFVCLNAGGAFCIAYCHASLTEAVVAGDDHCPLKKLGSDCERKAFDPGADSASALKGSFVDCCTMNLGFVGVPIEKSPFNDVDLQSSTHASEVRLIVTAQTRTVQASTLAAYRGPPLDRRPDRIRFRVFRI